MASQRHPYVVIHAHPMLTTADLLRQSFSMNPDSIFLGLGHTTVPYSEPLCTSRAAAWYSATKPESPVILPFASESFTQG